MARLIVSLPDGTHTTYEIKKPVVKLGRGDKNDLVLPDGSVSRFHAEVRMSGEGVAAIADLGSTNGVVVDGKKITAETPLVDGAQVKVGIFGMKFESPQPQESGLVVQSADIPAALREVLQGNALRTEYRRTPAQFEKVESPQEKLDRLSKENFLLRLLYDAGKALNEKRSVEELANQVVELSFRVEGVERGTIMFLDDDGEVTKQTAVRYRVAPTESAPKIIFSRTILRRLMQERAPILVTDLTGDDRFVSSLSMKISGMQSAMVAPLISPNDGRVFGVLYVDNLSRTLAFSQDELNVLAVVAAQAAAAIDGQFAHERLAEEAIRRQALGRFLAPEVVKMVEENPDGVRLGGTNQKVSVLFCDIRGFTSMSETMAPEKVVEILNKYFDGVTKAIFEYGGTLDKYIGDAAMAIFGAPISKGNDTERAVLAGVAIQKLVSEMNRDAGKRGHPEIKVGVGINTGVVTAGNIGSTQRLDYTVIGDEVNLASRMCGKAEAGQVLITESTFKDVREKFRLTPLAPVMVKGKSLPINIFSVQWEEPAMATQ
jgi:adenylate cyclase